MNKEQINKELDLRVIKAINYIDKHFAEQLNNEEIDILLSGLRRRRLELDLSRS